MCGKTKSKKGEPPAQTKGRFFVFTMIRSQDLIAASKIDHFHFSSCRVSFLCLCFVVFTSVLGIDSVELKVLAIE